MSENDYIAEYVKEKRPEIIHSLDFMTWKIQRTFKNIANELATAVKDFVVSGGDVEELLAGEETEGSEEDGSTECAM